MASLDNLMLVGAQQRYEALRFPPSDHQASLEVARQRFWRSMDDGDITGEIDGDVAERLIQLIQAQDANGAGRLLVATMNAWADRLAAREVYA